MTPTPAGRRQPSFPGAPCSRRALLQLGFASAVALVVNACGGSSKSTATTATPAAAGGSTTAPGVASTSPAAAAASPSTTVGAAAAPAGPPIRTGSQLTIDFTYTLGAGGFGPARNP